MGCDTVNGADNPEEWGFLLTHPVWDVTPNRTRKRPTMRKISTHTSRVGCDPSRTAQHTVTCTFLLTHPVWDVTTKQEGKHDNKRFLLTHPVWDVTLSQPYGCTLLTFLLTHPVWDVTAIYSIFQSHYSHILQDGPIIHLELY